MLTFRVVAVVAILTSIGAYGVHQRKKWAWYAGIVFQFFAASAISLLGYGIILQIGTTVQAVYAIMAIVGAIAIWSSWVAWWGRHRDEFGIDREQRPNAPRV